MICGAAIPRQMEVIAPVMQRLPIALPLIANTAKPLNLRWDVLWPSAMQPVKWTSVHYMRFFRSGWPHNASKACRLVLRLRIQEKCIGLAINMCEALCNHADFWA
jgi:hypothetical protein